MNKLKSVALLAAGFALPMAASRISRKVLGAGYEAVTDRPPPKNPASLSTGWKEAISWSILAGAMGGVARLLVNRAIAHTEIPATGYDEESQQEALVDNLQD
ncbi:hypothetical protein NT6N_05120 [Oceaniferula spumae]|uniref:DUF4235 domain-containing protein n=1 Tax=Oceaniferula spumae TaxID=2979115 RepID=A0AAT9FHK4_9BACT